MPHSTPSKGAETRARRIDEMMERASEALQATRIFECERLCLDALRIAHRGQDYERMARVLLPLQEARRLKRQRAADAGRIVQHESPDQATSIEPGCVLMHPPRCVGADGRALRERADKEETPLIVVVREPETSEGLWPIVAVGPATVRIRVEPPEELTPDWFLDVLEGLGDAAIESLNPEAPASTRINQLMDRLTTAPDHELLHQVLESACREAIRVGPDRRHPKPPLDDDEEDDEI